MRLPRACARTLGACTLVLLPLLANAQAVVLSGVLGSKALLVIDGGQPRALAAGEEHKGVRLVSIANEEAVVLVGQERRTLRMGDAPMSVGLGNAAATGRRIVLNSDSRGHFISQGSINGQPIQYMVDTGASTVALGRNDAERIGLNYQSGQPVRVGTANGMGMGWRLRLDSIRIGDVEVTGVDAIVTSQAMPFVLLGNNFLSDFHMTRTSEQMVLEKRR
jgi:aspartyl protease family protein